MARALVKFFINHALSRVIMKHKIKRLIKWFALWLFGSSLCLGLGVSFAYGVPACFTATQICGVTVLIEQYVQSAAVLEKAIALAPDLQQLHLRIEPSNNQSTVASTVALVEAIRAAGYKNNLVFHPNNYKDEADWGCATGDWKCVLKNSLAFMDAVNAQVKANNQEGFSSFSIEQSYLEPQNNADVLVQNPKHLDDFFVIKIHCFAYVNFRVQYRVTFLLIAKHLPKSVSQRKKVCWVDS